VIFGIRKWPFLPTIIVLAAVAVMVRLGFWQIDRLAEKEELLASYAAAAENPQALSSFPNQPLENLYRRTSLFCDGVTGWIAVAGRNASEQSGYAHVAQCNAEGKFAFDAPGWAQVLVGWSQSTEHPNWDGGQVTGMIGPGGENGWRLVADPPLAGLEANAMPDPGAVPNNHLAYAVQWFFFALTALVIYILALRRRSR